jgi:hypothetical protein
MPETELVYCPKLESANSPGSWKSIRGGLRESLPNLRVKKSRCMLIQARGWLELSTQRLGFAPEGCARCWQKLAASMDRPTLVLFIRGSVRSLPTSCWPTCAVPQLWFVGLLTPAL